MSALGLNWIRPKGCVSYSLKVKSFWVSVYKNFFSEKYSKYKFFRNTVSFNIQISVHFNNLCVGFVSNGMEKGALETDVEN